MQVSKRLIGAVLIFALWVPSSANAKTPRQQARALFRQGNRLYDRQDYEGALHRYRQAAKLYSSYKIDLNIANTLDIMGRRIEAVKLFEKFLERAKGEAPRAALRAAQQRYDALRRKLVSIQVLCSAEGADVTVDDEVVGVTPLQSGIYLEPGSHRLSLRKQGYMPFELELALGAGEHRQLTVPLQPVAAQDEPLPPVVPAPTPPVKISKPAPTPVVPAQENPQQQRKTFWAWGSLGAGSALVVTAVTLYTVGLVQGNDAHKKYRDAGPTEDIGGYWSDVESAKTKLIAGHVLMGLGAAAVGVSVYHFLTLQERRPSTTVGLGGTSGGAALWVSGRF
jgi:hypothetical protein